ncbi:MAG: protein translocase subunit SecF [Rhodocyclaceae bacterium]|jgi:preprotein translocase subunit SecF|nr:protein translocase subunit SecF [Rhodocyclaceae bacterium]
MEFFKVRNDIPFMRHALKFNIFSILTVVLAIFFIATRGLNLSVEFTGGTLIEVNYPEVVQVEPIRQVLLQQGYSDAQVQHFGSARDVLVRLPTRADMDSTRISETVMTALQAMDGPTPELRRAEYVGPQVGEELAEEGALALLLVLIGIMIYLALRFEWRFAVAAIVAILHDMIVILGFFALFQWDFSLPVLAAILAALGYSVNETVIVFDRVRETFQKRRGMTTPEVINHAITRVISRTVITHTTTLMVVFTMLLFGGETLHYFSLALAISIIFGMYSSMLVSSPLVMWLGVSREQFVKPKKEKEEAVV